jgi:hypothetical protein
MILNKRRIFTLVTGSSAGWGAALAVRSRIRHREMERRKMQELQKWESEGGEVSSPLAKLLP